MGGPGLEYPPVIGAIQKHWGEIQAEKDGYNKWTSMRNNAFRQERQDLNKSHKETQAAKEAKRAELNKGDQAKEGRKGVLLDGMQDDEESGEEEEDDEEEDDDEEEKDNELSETQLRKLYKKKKRQLRKLKQPKELKKLKQLKEESNGEEEDGEEEDGDEEDGEEEEDEEDTSDDEEEEEEETNGKKKKQKKSVHRDAKREYMKSMSGLASEGYDRLPPDVQSFLISLRINKAKWNASNSFQDDLPLPFDGLAIPVCRPSLELYSYAHTALDALALFSRFFACMCSVPLR